MDMMPAGVDRYSVDAADFEASEHFETTVCGFCGHDDYMRGRRLRPGVWVYSCRGYGAYDAHSRRRMEGVEQVGLVL